MAFNIEKWKEELTDSFSGWRARMSAAGVKSAYYFIAASAFLPIAQAFQNGQLEPLLFVPVASGIGANLLANIVQHWRDEATAAVQLQEAVKSDPELQPRLDSLLQQLDAISLAEKSLSQADRAWFAETLQKELAQLKSGISYTATLAGSGAIAQGIGAKAVGAGGILVEGSVKGDVIASGGTKIIQPDPRELEKEKNTIARQKYLQKLRRHCQALPLAALGGEESLNDISLDDVYIDLNTTLKTGKDGIEKLRRNRKISDLNLAEQALTAAMEIGSERPDREELVPVTLLDVAEIYSRIVILGNPGAGKSTFVKKLLAWQAAAILGECAHPVGCSADLIPILVILRDLSPRLRHLNLDALPAEQKTRRLAEVVYEQIKEDLRHLNAVEFWPVLEIAFDQGQVLLVFDGLDEVPQGLRQLVRQAVGALIQLHDPRHIIITSRLRSYTGSALFDKFQPFTIAPFEQEQIEKFGRAWYAAQHEIRTEQAEKRAKDLAQAATTPSLMEIASNPMMLTSIAIIHQKDIGLPNERVKLYHLVVDVLIRRWQKYKTGEDGLSPSPELVGFLKDDLHLRATLERLAYEAHRAGLAEKEAADLPRSLALTLLEQADYLGTAGLASEFLDYVDQRAGLLVGRGGDLERPTTYSFPHRTFQEYLAGCYLVGWRERGREVYKHAGEGDFWSLAALLGAEELFYNRRAQDSLLDLAYYLCPPKAHSSEQALRALLWSGEMACLFGKELIERDTGSPDGGQEYLIRLLPRLLGILESSLRPIERAEAGRVLAKLGDPRLDVLTCEQMTFCHVPAGDFLMGDKKEKTPMHQEYWMGKTPVTNAQFAQFVAARGYQNPDYWAEAIKEKYWSKDGFKGRYDNTPRTAPGDHGEPFNLPNHPVVGVTWYEARAFTRWLSEQLALGRVEGWSANQEEFSLREKIEAGGLRVDLPTEAEWEKAARGTDGRKYPWGENADPNRANYGEIGIGATSAVGCFPGGESPYGILDASGNVWQWTSSLYDKSSYALRGGSFLSSEDDVRCAFRYWDFPVNRLVSFGFRVMVSPLLLSHL